MNNEYLYLLRTLVYYNISIVLGYKQGVIYFYILPVIMQILWEFAMRKESFVNFGHFEDT